MTPCGLLDSSNAVKYLPKPWRWRQQFPMKIMFILDFVAASNPRQHLDTSAVQTLSVVSCKLKQRIKNETIIYECVSGTKFLSVLKLKIIYLKPTEMDLIFVVPCIMLNSEINPTRCNNCFYSSQWLYSTCFGWQFHSSSEVHKLYMASGRQVNLCCNFFSIMVVLSL